MHKTGETQSATDGDDSLFLNTTAVMKASESRDRINKGRTEWMNACSNCRFVSVNLHTAVGQ